MVEQCGTEGEVVRFEGAEASEHPDNTLGHTSRLAPTISTVLRKTISQLYFCSRMFPRRDSLQHRRKHVLISDFHLQRALQKENTASRTSSDSVNDHRVPSLGLQRTLASDVNLMLQCVRTVSWKRLVFRFSIYFY
jgi:hypothetical protein